MTIPSGTRLGPYAVVAPVGAGGMGEVFRAKVTDAGTILPTTSMRFLSDLPGSAWSARVYF